MILEFSWSLAIYIFVVTFGAFFVKGIAGFGDPLITTPLISLRVDPKLIPPANLIINSMFNAYMTYKNRKSFSIKGSLPMMFAILAGIIPGTFLLKTVDSNLLKALLGILVVGLGIEMATRSRAKKFKGNMPLMLIVSFCSGVSAALFGINLFFVAYVERTTDDRGQFRGTIGFLFFIENMFRIVVYLATGVFTTSVLLLYAICIPGAALGFFIGSKFDKKLSEELVRKIVYVVFIAGGVNTFVNAMFF